MIITTAQKIHTLLDKTRFADFLGPLLLRLYLAPIFWMAGTKKLSNMDGTIEWFGNAEWGLGLPFPTLLAYMATYTEIFGAIFLLFGFALRYISVPLLATMVVAAVTVHMKNGWLAIAEGAGSLFANERTIGAIDRLDKAKEILREYGNYDWLTGNGSFVVLNNGIEFAATYFVMLLVLFFIGAGRYVSIDYWLRKRFMPN